MPCKGRSNKEIVHGDAERVGFAEYHAQAAKAGAFMLRDRHMKLIYHVGMPPQLFDLAADPFELNDVAATAPETVWRLESRLRGICDPESSTIAPRPTSASGWNTGAERTRSDNRQTSCSRPHPA